MPEADEFIGPPAPRHPWEDWDEGRRAQMDKALEQLELAKNYRDSGNMAQPGAREAFGQLAAVGGLHPNAATLLARYRMAKQGSKDIPIGERTPVLTPDQIGARREEFFAASRDRKAQMMAEDKLAIDRSAEGYFDNLVRKPEPMMSKGRVNVPEKKMSAADVLSASAGKVRG